MAHVKIENDYLDIKLSLMDELLAFHGSFHIPLAHVTNAFVSDFEDLELQYKLTGTNFGFLKTAGVFANPQGLIFATSQAKATFWSSKHEENAFRASPCSLQPTRILTPLPTRLRGPSPIAAR